MNSRRYNYSAITKILGLIVLIVGVAMIVPWICAVRTGDANAAQGFRMCSPGLILIGGLVTLLFRSDRSRFGAGDGFLIVTLSWVLASLTGALPYYYSGCTSTFMEALFESTAGFTTTGSSCLPGGLTNPSLLLWKALSDWLGGMGILVFVISILPALGINGQFIVRAETPGPVYQKSTTRFSSSSRMLYITYFTFTLIEFLLLVIPRKVTFYEALVTVLGCVSTGGLLPYSEGIIGFHSLYIEIVVASFCLLASVNFQLYFYALGGKVRHSLQDPEFRAYVLIILFSVILCTTGLMVNSGLHFTSALRHSFFQTASMISTAGYVNSASFVWPASCQLILLCLSLTGGCSSSTSGSIKIVRILVMFKLIARNCVRRLHPRSVVAVKLNSNPVSAPVVSNITAFLLVYAGVLLMSAFILSLQGLRMEECFTTALALISNVGTSACGGTCTGTFSGFHPVLQFYLCGLMIAGRLELFTVIILFTKSFWGKNR